MTKEIQKWADVAMFKAEDQPEDGPKVYLLHCNNDPLGSIAAAAKAYKGEFVKSLAEITDEERRYYLEQTQKSVLAMPLESVNFHFRITGVTRGFTHQMVRQRTAAYCLSGDTEIHVDKKSRRRTIAELYEQWHNGPRQHRGPLSRMRIRTVTDSGMITTERIKNVFKQGVKPVYLVKTHDGKQIKATKDHLFMKPDMSFARLEEFSVGDELVSNGTELVRDEQWLKQKVDEGFSTAQIASIANCSVSHVKKYRRLFGFPGPSGLGALPFEERQRIGSINGSKPQRGWSEESKQRFSEWCKENRGGINPENWSGVDVGHRTAQHLYGHLYDQGCTWCGITAEEAPEGRKRFIQLAHIDGNPFNNAPDNVIPMCEPCHRNMDRGSLPRKIYPARIVSIEYVGEEMTYDIEMHGPYKRFSANGLIVHNSQESTRFAVKETVPVGRPPSLDGTVPWSEWVEESAAAIYPVRSQRRDWMRDNPQEVQEWAEGRASREQLWRKVWDETVNGIEDSYGWLVNSGMPAEDARGLLPTNLLTQLNYFTNLRNYKEEAGKRLCTQSQFEWRLVFAEMVKAIREYGKTQSYKLQGGSDGLHSANVHNYSSAWQFDALADLFRPICYYRGKCQFEADYDRACTIRKRVNANAFQNRPSTEWSESKQYGDSSGEPVDAIHPEEWLLDPTAARRQS